jgi:hypothetical protein
MVRFKRDIYFFKKKIKGEIYNILTRPLLNKEPRMKRKVSLDE